MVDPLSYFSFQPVLQDWYNKNHGMYCPVCEMAHIKDPLLLIRKYMYCPVCGMVHIKDALLLIKKSSPCSGSMFPLSRYLSGPI